VSRVWWRRGRWVVAGTAIHVAITIEGSVVQKWLGGLSSDTSSHGCA
jgi:hypothetical protein